MNQSFILIYVLRTEVKDQFPLDYASIVDKHSRVADLECTCEFADLRLEQCIDLFDDLLRNRFDFFPLGDITLVVCDIIWSRIW